MPARSAPRKTWLTFEELPLFPSDEQIAEALFGDDKERCRKFLDQISVEEKHGFPRRSLVYGDRRYGPAVRAYFDHMYGLRDEPARGVLDGEENWQIVPRREKAPGRKR
jgi:hypothetical protein